MGSRRPARAGGGRRRRCRDAIARWCRTSRATARRRTGRRASTPARRTSARSRRRGRSRSAATRWAGGSRCTPRSRSGPEIVTRLVLVGASPGLADPAERAARRAADDALAARIETLDIEAFAREWGAQPLFAGQPERVAAARARGSAAQHAGRAGRRPARSRDRRDGAAVGPPAGAGDPGDADRRRARREVPRHRRRDARSAYRMRSSWWCRTPATRFSSSTPAAVADAIHQSFSSSSASA